MAFDAEKNTVMELIVNTLELATKYLWDLLTFYNLFLLFSIIENIIADNSFSLNLWPHTGGLQSQAFLPQLFNQPAQDDSADPCLPRGELQPGR